VLLVDTNVWLAAADRRSTRHDGCSRLIAEHDGELAATAPVVAETGWLLLDRGGPTAQAGFVEMVTAGRLEVVDLTPADWARVHELVVAYADLPLDLVDASIVAIAERLDLSTIATLDHRDFRVVRPAHCDAFDLVPSA
jgi:predicted nucleic acid-binding protein